MTTGDPLSDALARARRRRTVPPPEALRRTRELAGLSQTDVARACGVSTAAISLWESGKRRPRDLELIGRYLAVLKRVAHEGMRGG